jgi:mono/diheme cytochrome c family protein
MKLNPIPGVLLALGASVLLAACGGGGSPGDHSASAPPPAVPVATLSEPNAFLTFPNPQKQADGTLQTTSLEYAQAYYREIDPLNERDTAAKYRAKNGFDSGTGEQVMVIFGDVRDLGTGRRMTVRRNVDGTIAFFVENYSVKLAADYAFNTANLDAAIVRDTRWLPYSNGIEFSPGPNGGASFPKFYNFNGTTGERQLEVSIDGRGVKAMPGICISCHGGRGDPLSPPDATGKRRFPIVANGVSQARGDVQAHLHPLEADALAFSDTPGFTRAEQEASIKKINTWILCSYPKTAADTAPEDACRREANASEWQGTAAAMLKAAYGGNGLPNATFKDTYVPESWEKAGQSTLYRSVVATSCRACHVMRGVVGNSDLDFTSYEKFASLSDRIKTHIIDRGNMPLVKLIYDRFWGTTTANVLGNFLQEQGYTVKDASGAMLMPGRPLADPGPDRVVLPGATTLNGSNSLYSNAYAWSLVSGPTGATITNATAAQATFTAATAGTYVVQLVTSNGSLQSAPAQFRIVVNPTLSPAPSSIRFSHIKAVIQGTCVQCHSPTGALPRPPVFWSDTDRNGDGSIDATDELWLYTDVRGRINFTELGASALLRKPSGNHHGGALQVGFDTTKVPGDPARANYDLFVNWILNGAPQ